jgi:hypothetical protein
LPPRTAPQVIGAARQYIDSSAVFSLEDPSEALDRFKLALKVATYAAAAYAMGYTMGSMLRAIPGRPYDSTVLITPAAPLQVCGLFKSAYFDAKVRVRVRVRARARARVRARVRVRVRARVRARDRDRDRDRVRA